jgi:hypothetical protein
MYTEDDPSHCQNIIQMRKLFAIHLRQNDYGLA